MGEKKISCKFLPDLPSIPPHPERGRQGVRRPDRASEAPGPCPASPQPRRSGEAAPTRLYRPSCRWPSAETQHQTVILISKVCKRRSFNSNTCASYTNQQMDLNLSASCITHTKLLLLVKTLARLQSTLDLETSLIHCRL